MADAAVEVNDDKEVEHEHYNENSDFVGFVEDQQRDLADISNVMHSVNNQNNAVVLVPRTEPNRTFSVGEPIMRSSAFTKWQSYKVETTPTMNDVKSVHRRYRDFTWLRDYLKLRYPGVFFPPLPPKKALARFNEDFIQERRNDLERFLNRLAEISFMEEDIGYVAFVSRHEDSFDEVRKKIDSDLLKDSAPEQATNVLRTRFPDIGDFDVGPDPDEYILRLKEFLTKSEEQLELLWHTAHALVEKATQSAQEAKRFSEILTVLDGVEKNYAQKPEPARLAVMGQFESWAECYKQEASLYGRYLEDQIKYEFQDIRAFLEVVTQRDAILILTQKAVVKADKWRADEHSGQFLSERQSKLREADLASEEAMQEYLTAVTKVILGSQIQLAWGNKVQTFRANVLKFAQLQLANCRQLSDVWETMLRSADNA